MAKKVKKSKNPHSGHLSPVMQVGVVFVIVMAMVLLMYAAKQTP